MRVLCGFVVVLAGFSLSACDPSVPDSGVGFDDYASYEQRRTREAELTGAPVVQQVISPEAPQSAVVTQPIDDSAEPVQASPSNPAPEIRENAGISDENDFQAVSSRESIASDAARIQQNRARYQIVDPTDLPQRSGQGGPNIVDYALNTNNPVGQALYSRTRRPSVERVQRNCAQYPSPDLAQQAFLSNGGPQRDRLALDPDGDGFACTWDPAPFRRATAG